MAQDRIARLKARLAAKREEMADTPVPDASPAKPVQATPTPTPTPTPVQPTVPTPSATNLAPSVVPLDEEDPYYNFRHKLAEIEMRLNDEVPNFGIILRELHSNLSEDPNIVTVLSPEEIGVIVKGLTATANVTIAPKTASKSTTRRTQQLSIADI